MGIIETQFQECDKRITNTLSLSLERVSKLIRTVHTTSINGIINTNAMHPRNQAFIAFELSNSFVVVDQPRMIRRQSSSWLSTWETDPGNRNRQNYDYVGFICLMARVLRFVRLIRDFYPSRNKKRNCLRVCCYARSTCTK